jgi:hypothetical protein
MNGQTRRLRIVDPSQGVESPAPSTLERDEADEEQRGGEAGLAAALFLVGLVPVAGLALLGHWPAWEVGAGAAMSLFALRQLALPRQ